MARVGQGLVKLIAVPLAAGHHEAVLPACSRQAATSRSQGFPKAGGFRSKALALEKRLDGFTHVGPCRKPWSVWAFS